MTEPNRAYRTTANRRVTTSAEIQSVVEPYDGTPEYRMPTAEEAERERRVIARALEAYDVMRPEPDHTSFMSGVAVALLLIREDTDL